MTFRLPQPGRCVPLSAFVSQLCWRVPCTVPDGVPRGFHSLFPRSSGLGLLSAVSLCVWWMSLLVEVCFSLLSVVVFFFKYILMVSLRIPLYVLDTGILGGICKEWKFLILIKCISFWWLFLCVLRNCCFLKSHRAVLCFL